ncbi:hypothetical protein [uncultured Sphingomonas sp.]|uniref:hypothetical protein n=1 Tax=uncultured Sphingomonas sp. TaxID=158754 RepID=UPI0025FBE760|nr:hypothetical protein [uncultured Sphingomonas sp.]
MNLAVRFSIADFGPNVQPCGMQYGSIVAFLSGTLSPETLAAEIKPEVARFRATLKKTGEGRVPALAGPPFVVTRQGARRLREAVAYDRLPYDTASYLADCIVMNDDLEFADEATRDAVFFIEDDTARFATGNDEWCPSQTETLAALAALG